MDSPRPLVLALLGCALLLAPAAPAQAGVAALSDGTLTYQGAPGEVNRVSLAEQAGGYTIRDEGAPVSARGLGCVAALDGRSATCAGRVSSIRVLAGDGDDTVAMPEAYGATGASVDGEAGSDQLTGGRTAGAQNGELLLGGEGGDALVPRDGGRASGGPDTDLLRCAGGAAGCYLDGGDAGDLVAGGPLTDLIEGGNGADLINGGAGSDVLLAGNGDDQVDSRDSVGENVFCGEGNDTLNGDAEDRSYDCDVVGFTAVPTAFRARTPVAGGEAVRRGRVAVLRVATRIAQVTPASPRVPCGGGRVRFTVSVSGRVLARPLATVSPGCVARARLRVQVRGGLSTARAFRVSTHYLGNGLLRPQPGRATRIRIRGPRPQ